MSRQVTYKVGTSPLAAFLAFGAVVLFACLFSKYFISRIGHDQTSYLLEAQRVLSGIEAYGPHLSETNPPLIIWFSALPILLARRVPESAVLFFKLLVLAMTFGSVAWCVRLLRRNPALANPAAVGLLGCATLLIECSIGPYDFGQREHLLILLLLPYVLAAANRVIDRLPIAERCALGVAAGIAIWFKPQDVLILIALELFLALRAHTLRRLRAPEFVSLVLTSSVLLLLVRLITPRYFTDIYPLLLDTYWALGTKTTIALALSLSFYTPLVLVLLLTVFLLRRWLRDPTTSLALLLCSIAGSFAYDVQHTEWKYHRYPHSALLELAIAYLLVDLCYPAIARFTSNARLIRQTLLLAASFVAVALCAVAIRPRAVLPQPGGPQPLELDRFLVQCKPSTTVYIFSTDVYPMASVYNHGLNWGGRFAHLWMMPAIVQNELGPTGPPAPFKQLSPDTLSKLATLQRTESAEDLDYWRPSLVLVQHCSPQQSCLGIEGKNFNMLAWFLQSPRFAAAWSNYRQQPGLDDFDVYKLVP
jgi:hypothetical protein